MSLDDITRQLGQTYRDWKEREKAKNSLRDKFFEEVTRELEETVPAQVTEEIAAESEEEALRMAQRQFIRHSVVAHEEVSPGVWRLVLEEDPSLRPYTYVNKEDGMVYQRIISEGAPSLDDEAIKEERPELWERITKEVVTRELIPLEEMSEEDVWEIQPYITMPKPQVRLGAPRPAKPEELDD